MLRDYAESFGSSAGHTAIKRNVDHFDKDSFIRPRSKRICTSNLGAQWQCQQYIYEENNIGHQQEQQQQHMTDVGFLTPATTPAEVTTAHASLMEDIPSPYSEAEDYMVRGYYEDDRLIYDSRSCVESVQYNLYDMTPEEYELNNGDDLEFNHNNSTTATLRGAENNSALVLGRTECPNDQVAFDDINNEVIYYESSDINM